MMSSKFGGIAKTQKTPAVCKKPPPPAAVPPPPFLERTFQGYCQWYDTIGSDRIRTAGNLTMLPDPPTTTWTGETATHSYSVQVKMKYQQPMNAFDFTIDLLLNGHSVGQYKRLLQPPRSLDPFDSGLVDFIGQGGQQIIYCRIIS